MEDEVEAEIPKRPSLFVSCGGGSQKGKEQMVGPMDAFTTSDPELASHLQERLKQSNITDTLVKERRDWVYDQWAAWAYENAIPFNALCKDSFARALLATGEYGKGLKPPSMYMWREPLLQRAKQKTEESLKEHEVEWGKTGCSIMTDAWSDRKMRSVMNLCVHCRLGTSFYDSEEKSDESHTGEFIFRWVDQNIEKIGEDKVIQVVTDNHSANMAAKELLKSKRPRIFWTSCAAHTVDLMLEAMGKLHNWKATIGKAKEITRFIYNHQIALATMRKLTKKKEIVRA